jgi:anion-transporting  ArsA/GET3 family ATPase
MMAGSLLHWPENLFAHRMVFVMGKGGVGKTTVSVLMGLAASRLGKNVLLVELGDSDAIGGVFTRQTLPENPVLLSERLWGVRVNPKSELSAYTHAHINSGFIAHRITRSRLFDYLFAATPGLKEVMSLGRIWRWERSVDDTSSPVYDLIIVDSPATGHGLSLLRLPVQLIQMIRVGPIVSQIKELQGLLQDQRKTCIALVSLPEELPVNETLEFYSAAQSSLSTPVRAVFMNGVWPPQYSNDEIRQIDTLPDAAVSGPMDESLRVVLTAARNHINRRLLQDQYISQITSAVSCPVIEVPFYFTNDLSPEDLDQISRLIHTSSNRQAG